MILLLFSGPVRAASGRAFNALVVVNTNSADSIELGEYYAEQHGIPSHHICRLGIATNLVSATSNQFQSLLLTPITNHLAAEGLTGQIDFVVLSWAFPTRVENVEGVSASLFYGFQDAPAYNEGGIGCNLPDYTSNAFYRAERSFRSIDAWNATNGFITFHLIASNLPTAKLVADRGAAAQSSFPDASIHLHMIGSIGRSVREARYATTQFSFTALPGLPVPCVLAPYYFNLSGQTNVIGYQDGYGYIPGDVQTNNVWLDGAYADHLTSCGGMIPDPCYSQHTILHWMGIGATASYGTVAEPCNYLEKFPDPLMAFWYARGFTVGEAYAMSVEAPYQGLFAGDPLAAPFAAPPVITITSPAPCQIVSGTIPVPISAAARSNGAPPAVIDFYLDSRLQTNLATVKPTRNNQLSVVVGGRTNSTSVTVLKDTLFEVVESLADAVNADGESIVAATAHGDRLELIYKSFDHDGDHVPVSASVSTGTAATLTLGVGLAATNLHPSIYFSRKRLWLVAHSNGVPIQTANAGDTVTCTITLTNGVAVTNTLVATGGETITNLLERLRMAISTNATLMATNGVRYDRLANGVENVLNNGTLFARTPGPDGWGIQIDYAVTPVQTNFGLRTNVSFSSFMDDNPVDIRPRASVLFHVSPTNGLLSITPDLDTTLLDDGLHDLDFVVRDGSAIAASSRFTLPIVVANTSLVLTVSSSLGTSTPPAGIHLHPLGTALTNSVSSPAPNGGTQLVCTGWTMMGNQPLSGSGTNFTMTLTNHAELTWHWTTNHWLDTEAASHGTVNISDSWQPAGVTTQITATADPYYHFTHWTGDASSSTNPLDLLMDSPKAITAHFAENLAAYDTPEWWLAQYGWTNDFDAAATNDAEPDGFFTWQEYIADTDPTSTNSVLPSLEASCSTNLLSFSLDPTSTGRHYFIDSSLLLAPPAWTNLTNTPGNGGAWLPEFTAPGTGIYFFRGRITLPP